MSEPAKKPERGCGCACLGCLGAMFALSLLAALLLALGFWIWGDLLLAKLFHLGGDYAAQAVEKVVVAQTKEPQKLPSLPQSPEVASEVAARFQEEWQKPSEDGKRRLKLSEEEANLVLRSTLKSPDAPAALKVVHDMYVQAGADSLRLQGVLRGPALAALLPENLPTTGVPGAPGAGTYRWMRSLLTRAEYVNMDGEFSVQQSGDSVSLKPETLKLLGLPLPVGMIDGLVGLVRDKLAEAGGKAAPGGPALPGIPVPGVSRLAVRPGELELVVDPGKLPVLSQVPAQ